MPNFYTADPHFGDNSIIRHCHRPFTTAEEMDEALIANWNARVAKSDHVYVVGDFAMRMPEDRLRLLWGRLRGMKHLIIGNHDDTRVKRLAWASKRESHTVKEPDGTKIDLAHYARREWPGFFRGHWHFYGHSHDRLPGVGKSEDVGVDSVARMLRGVLPDGTKAPLDPAHYRPVTAAEMFALMEGRPEYDPHTPREH